MSDQIKEYLKLIMYTHEIEKIATHDTVNKRDK